MVAITCIHTYLSESPHSFVQGRGGKGNGPRHAGKLAVVPKGGGMYRWMLRCLGELNIYILMQRILKRNRRVEYRYLNMYFYCS